MRAFRQRAETKVAQRKARPEDVLKNTSQRQPQQPRAESSLLKFGSFRVQFAHNFPPDVRYCLAKDPRKLRESTWTSPPVFGHGWPTGPLCCKLGSAEVHFVRLCWVATFELGVPHESSATEFVILIYLLSAKMAFLGRKGCRRPPGGYA